jgi:uncharacterized membrane protein
MAADLAWPFEVLIAPLVFALCLHHAHKALAPGRAAVEILALAAYAFVVDYVSASVLTAQTYSPAWRVAPLGIPLAVPLMRASLLMSGLALASRASLRTPWSRAAGAALLGLTLDLLVEPAAVGSGLWRYAPPGSWMGVPLTILLGRATALGAYAWGIEAFSVGSLGGVAFRRVLLACLTVVVLAGFGLGASVQIEALIPPGAGWALWMTVLVTTVILVRHRGGSSVGTSMASRLGAVPGNGPGLVLLLLAAAFVTHAVLAGPPFHTVALGPALVFVLVGGADVHRMALDSWRTRMHGRLSGVESFVAVLMKRRNNEPWTREERAFLQAQFRAMARYLPALVLFLLPGSVILLPLYAWLLDRRRGDRKEEAAGPVVAGPRARVGATPPPRRPFR